MNTLFSTLVLNKPINDNIRGTTLKKVATKLIVNHINKTIETTMRNYLLNNMEI